MAIAFDSTGNTGIVITTSSTTSQTNTAGTFMAIVIDAIGRLPTWNAATYAGAASTSQKVVNDGATLQAEIRTIASPATGANNLVLTPDASTKFVGGIITFTGVGSVGAVGGTSHPNVVGSSFSDTITTGGANSVVVTTCASGQHSGTVADTVTSGNTRFAIAASQTGMAGDILLASGGANSVGWQSTVSYGGIADFVQSLVELTPSGGAPAVSTPTSLMLTGIGM